MRWPDSRPARSGAPTCGKDKICGATGINNSGYAVGFSYPPEDPDPDIDTGPRAWSAIWRISNGST